MANFLSTTLYDLKVTFGYIGESPENFMSKYTQEVHSKILKSYQENIFSFWDCSFLKQENQEQKFLARKKKFLK